MKKRWTVADAQAVIDRMAVSGLSVREFAEAEGLETQRIYRWRSLLGEKRRPAFVEVKRPALVATDRPLLAVVQGAQLRAFVREIQR
jgi:transposase-like protein